MQTSNPSWQRRNNLAVLARAVWQNPGVSRRDLDHRFQIDKSSISRLVQVLLDLGLVETAGRLEGPEGGQGGRPRVALRVRADFGQVWGLALWPDKARLTILDARGDVVALDERRFPAYDGDWTGYLSEALAFASAAAPRGLPLLGVGFGVPGWVDFSQGRVVQSLPFRVENFRPAWETEALPVLWENDANCGAWSCQSPSSDLTDALYVLGRSSDRGPGDAPGLSVGYGVVIGGRLHRGWRHRAGEFRSALWRPGGGTQFGGPDAVADLVSNLRSAAELLDPQTIFLGGDLKFHADRVTDAMEALGWDARGLLSPLATDTDEVSLGAAQLVLDELFQLPSHPNRSLFRNYGADAPNPLWRGLGPEAWPAVLARLPTLSGGATLSPRSVP